MARDKTAENSELQERVRKTLEFALNNVNKVDPDSPWATLGRGVFTAIKHPQRTFRALKAGKGMYESINEELNAKYSKALEELIGTDDFKKQRDAELKTQYSLSNYDELLKSDTFKLIIGDSEL